MRRSRSSRETTFTRDVADADRLRRTLLELSEGVGARLRADGVDARTIAIKLRYADFSTLTRQVTLADPTHLDQLIFRAAWSLFEKTWMRRPVRLLGIAARNLGTSAHQLNLFEPRDERSEKLIETVDKIRAKFGDDALKRASLTRKRVKRDKSERRA